MRKLNLINNPAKKFLLDFFIACMELPPSIKGKTCFLFLCTGILFEKGAR